MLVDYEGKQAELEETLSKMTQRVHEHETAARVGEETARPRMLETFVCRKRRINWQTSKEQRKHWKRRYSRKAMS